MKDKYDVIIIGAGVGGLVCGCYLAQNGLKVLVVEKNKNAGGCASSWKWNDFVFDVGAHLVGGCDHNGLFDFYLRKLNVKVDFIKLNPFDRLIFGKEVINIPDDLGSYISELKNRFPGEGNGLEVFFKELIKIYRSFLTDKQYLTKYAKTTYAGFLETVIKDKKLRGILSGQCVYIGLPPKRASLIAASFMLVSYLRDGTYYTKGGMQNLAKALASKITAYSGDILYSTNVKSIRVEKNAARGVIINNGNFIEGRIIVSNMDAKKTFLKLDEKDGLSKAFFKKMLKLKEGLSVLQLNVGVDVNDEPLREIGGWYYQDYDMDKSFKSAFYVFVPSIFDKTVVPEGRNILHMLMLSRYDRNTYNRKEALGRDVESKFLKELKKHTRLDLKNRIITKIALTPQDIENFTGNSLGSAFGWEMSPNYVLNNRLGNKSYLDNLYLTGHWTNPGCGVLGVATSGMITGGEVLRNFYGG